MVCVTTSNEKWGHKFERQQGGACERVWREKRVRINLIIIQKIKYKAIAIIGIQYNSVTNI